MFFFHSGSAFLKRCKKSYRSCRERNKSHTGADLFRFYCTINDENKFEVYSNFQLSAFALKNSRQYLDYVAYIYMYLLRLSSVKTTSASTHFPRAFKAENYCLIYHTILTLALQARGVRILVSKCWMMTLMHNIYKIVKGWSYLLLHCFC